MAALIITHTPADGTRLEGTSRDDGAAELLNRAGWRWVRRIGWHLPGSSDHTPRRPAIDATANRLREAGYRVEVAIEPPPAAHLGTRPVVAPPAPSLATLDRRIDALEAKHRRGAQALAGYRNQLGRDVPPAVGSHRTRLQGVLTSAAAELEQLRAQRAAMIASGETAGFTQNDVSHGNEVEYRGNWLRAVRVNKRTVTAQTVTGTFQKLEYGEISAIRSGAGREQGRGD